LKNSDHTVAVIGAHSKPDAAVAEANWLDDVAAYVIENEAPRDLVIAGDLNLDCDYASQQQLDSLDLRADSSFNWLITDDQDTSVAQASCAYDRIVHKGPSPVAERGVVARDIRFSDHRPVHATLAGVRIVAHNMQVFGQSKSVSDDALAEIAQIVCDSDLAVLQEIVSADPDVIEPILDAVRSTCGAVEWGHSLSDPVGTTSYKERFLFVFRSGKLSLRKAWLYPQADTPATTSTTTTTTPTATTSTPSAPQATTTTKSSSCGVAPYVTPGGYCYATFGGSKKRVSGSCCGL